MHFQQILLEGWNTSHSIRLSFQDALNVCPCWVSHVKVSRFTTSWYVLFKAGSRWKPLGVKSGLYGGCYYVSLSKFWGQVPRRTLSWRGITVSLKGSGKFSQNRFSPAFHRPVNLLTLPGETSFPVGHHTDLLKLCSSSYMPRITWLWTLEASLVYMETFWNFNDFLVSNNFLWSNIIYTLFLKLQGGASVPLF